MRKTRQKAGPNPKCQGCGKKIFKDDNWIRHKLFARPTNTHIDVWQFHLKAECLTKMKEEYKESFRAKEWNLAAVSKEINWMGVLEQKMQETGYEDITN